MIPQVFLLGGKGLIEPVCIRGRSCYRDQALVRPYRNIIQCVVHGFIIIQIRQIIINHRLHTVLPVIRTSRFPFASALFRRLRSGLALRLVAGLALRLAAGLALRLAVGLALCTNRRLRNIVPGDGDVL